MTGAAVLPTIWTALDQALRTRRPVLVTYHQRRRLVCPHAIGWKNTRAMVLGYQTGGDTTNGTLDPDPRKRWRVFYLDEIDRVDPADSGSRWGTADNYNPAHPFPAIDDLIIAVDTEPSPKRR
jgi:hypothetical protein